MFEKTTGFVPVVFVVYYCVSVSHSVRTAQIVLLSSAFALMAMAMSLVSLPAEGCMQSTPVYFVPPKSSVM